MKTLQTFYKEDTDGARAEVFEENGVYGVHYYMGIGDAEWFKQDIFAGKSLHYAEDAAENWALGIKTLNG
jgi:hypothetical protein|tara:strand:- start:1704 stop:1913 length:210 start_codon:yes stop_codon:yes gene_type:complete